MKGSVAEEPERGLVIVNGERPLWERGATRGNGLETGVDPDNWRSHVFTRLRKGRLRHSMILGQESEGTVSPILATTLSGV